MRDHDYQRIALAIEYLAQHTHDQPRLDDVASAIHLSPFHCQRLFTEWAGVSPKQFLQFLTLDHAKQLLSKQHSLQYTSDHTGLSSTSRLHDLFIKLECMTPGEFKQGACGLTLEYYFYETLFGLSLIANTERGICYIAFVDDPKSALIALQQRYPQSQLKQQITSYQEAAATLLVNPNGDLQQLKLHLIGTPFQLNVWQALLNIPFAQVATYGKIAQSIANPSAARAVGTAIGNNPIAYLIPCHRVIRQSGQFGDYRWGRTRKQAILGWESARHFKETTADD
ncbi:methylated-DNA--[protein]-cysteine S-methyltransferase [Marinomonas ostreistagni]|uniref:methylated-DNA--[protein]-cysteine S-methyltransferase n=1 Tax=Marinomonas ostreistagni TaxID=359209 RepID=UPI0019509A92|nr:methylated-DNA--[protein]-cysteine S-methyltransferase [Marinomonas ostreistagni]MBM6551724.1 methylated-DNA--[protein]-cysteine S-methyltransferase [Marinomonas ostreistagni]